LNNQEKARIILNRLSSRDKELFLKLKSVLAKFNDANSQIPKSIITIVKEIDNSSYNKYFVKPDISILSPSDNFYTKDSVVKVKFEFKHNKPIKLVNFGAKEVFKRTDDRFTEESEFYTSTFDEALELQPGVNKVVISLVDIFGLDASTTFSVFCDRFSTGIKYIEPNYDSLKNAVALLNSYVSLKNLPNEPLNLTNLYAFDTKSDLRSVSFISKMFELSEFYEQKSDKVRFVSEINNSNENILYLLKNFKFSEPNSLFNVVLSGKWNRTNEDYQVVFFDKILSLKGICSTLKGIKIQGINLIIDGYEKDRSELRTYLVESFKNSLSPINILVTDKNFSETLYRGLTNPITSTDSLFESNFSLADLQQFSTDVTYIAIPEVAKLPFCKNPFASGRKVHQSILPKLATFLKEQKVPTKDAQKIIDFCKNWRTYGEIKRYIDKTLTTVDFISRIDEYNSRMKEGKK
jgi:hypothetical protein